jgi:hypothetical protein
VASEDQRRQARVAKSRSRSGSHRYTHSQLPPGFCRLTGTHHTTILKVLVIAGERCERLIGEKIVNVPVKDVQADEIWSFVGKKQKAMQPGDDTSLGDAYCFVCNRAE